MEHSRETYKSVILALAIKHKMTFSNVDLLYNWFDCFDYILPSERKLVLLPVVEVTCARDVLSMWLLCNIIESRWTVAEQITFANSKHKAGVILL